MPNLAFFIHLPGSFVPQATLPKVAQLRGVADRVPFRHPRLAGPAATSWLSASPVECLRLRQDGPWCY